MTEEGTPGAALGNRRSMGCARWAYNQAMSEAARGHWDESNRELVAIIRDQIERHGPITFAKFMQLALYHPEHGYYLTAAPRAGRAGDFITAPEAHAIFGQTLALQIAEIWHRLDRPDPFTLREYGAGAGVLAHAILQGLEANEPELLAALRYEPVEINPARGADLAERLAAAGFGDNLHEPVPGATITGCVLANEFVDAFPVHRIEQRDGDLRELYVVWRDNWFAEVPGPPSTPEIAARLARVGVTLAEGQRAEVNLGIDDWARELGATLARGCVLVFDYGYPAGELYGPKFPGGTLKAYLQHTVHEDPFRAVGQQDLTAHVDLTALAQAAADHGLTSLGLTTQADFLAGAGIGELLVALQQQPGVTVQSYVVARTAVMHLIDPGGMGRFRVLVLGRGIAPEPPLRGLGLAP